MDLVRRVQDILLKPKDTWPAIDAEPADAKGLYTGYLMILALIPALASFIGMSFIGVGAFGFSMRVPVLWGLSSMVVHYVMTLVMVYVLAVVVDALAPNFGGTQSRIQALKLVVYGSTAALVGGIFSLVPALSNLGLLAALYSIYLFYVGLPVLMKCPQDKAVGYTVVVGLISLVAGWIIAAVAAAVTMTSSHMGLGGMGSMGGGTHMTINTPKGEVTIDSSKIEAATKQMQAAAERMQKRATEGAVSADQLKPLLPDAVGDLKRESIESAGDGNGLVSSATGEYRNGDRSLKLTIVDVGGGLGAAAAMWASMTIDRDTPEETEKIYHDGKRSVHEKVSKQGGSSEYQVVLDNGIMVSAEGQGLDLAALKAAVSGLDLAKAESLQRTAKAP